MATSIGVLTAGGDAPGLNAAIRALGRSAIRRYGWNVVGFREGFRGLMQNRAVRLDSDTRKTVPVDHPWVESARSLGVCLGDRV